MPGPQSANGAKTPSHAAAMDHAQFARLLAEQLADRRTSFTAEAGWLILPLGGLFRPTCSEMAALLPAGAMQPLAAGAVWRSESAPQRLYYEPLREYTHFEFMALALRGSGRCRIEVLAQSENAEISLFTAEIELKPGQGWRSERLALASLLANGSLVVRLQALSALTLESLRWLGMVREDLAQTGERIVAVRTFGNRATVVATLSAVVERLGQVAPEVLARTLFLIYDATGDRTQLASAQHIKGARIVELKGANYGGGGNASLLTSLLIEVDRRKPGKIAELVLFDDDAQIDAETFLRQDAFIAARKSDVLSTAVIYSQTRPTLVQEFGGLWGRHFNPANHVPALSGADEQRLFMPYLVRANRDLRDEWTRRYLGTLQDVEFSTFIFISFPMRMLRKIGAPLPFFLRDDDAEICLRAQQAGYRVAVNPNLFAWHEASASPVGEFYNALHSLILNNLYGGIDEAYFYRLFTDRLAKLAAVGNLVMLRACEQALALYARGPAWMQPESIFEEYVLARTAINEAMGRRYCSQIPLEIQSLLSGEQQLEVRGLSEPQPLPPTRHGRIVFVDGRDGRHYAFKATAAERACLQAMKASLGHLAQIAADFAGLGKAWRKHFSKFDHAAFWRQREAARGEALQLLLLENAARPAEIPAASGAQPAPGGVRELSKEDGAEAAKRLVARMIASKTDQASELHKLLPPDFDPAAYLRKNPDLQAAGVDPVKHWLLHGRNEGRLY